MSEVEKPRDDAQIDSAADDPPAAMMNLAITPENQRYGYVKFCALN